MNIEQQRLAECDRGAARLEEMGSVLERTAVGHGARGLQPARQCLGIFSARSRAQPRLSLGRGWHRRDFPTTSRRCACRWALWNERDPILKERLFGLTNGEGNHGEDVKELYYYLDATPTHSYLKMLYKYPQARLSLRGSGCREPAPRQRGAGIRTARYRSIRRRPLLRRVRRIRAGRHRRRADADHGVQPRPRRGTAAPAAAARVPQHLELEAGRAQAETARATATAIVAEHEDLGTYRCHARSADGPPPQWLLTENETNSRNSMAAEAAGPFKDGFHEYLIDGRERGRHPHAEKAPRRPRIFASNVPRAGFGQRAAAPVARRRCRRR